MSLCSLATIFDQPSMFLSNNPLSPKRLALFFYLFSMFLGSLGVFLCRFRALLRYLRPKFFNLPLTIMTAQSGRESKLEEFYQERDRMPTLLP